MGEGLGVRAGLGEGLGVRAGLGEGYRAHGACAPTGRIPRVAWLRLELMDDFGTLVGFAFNLNRVADVVVWTVGNGNDITI